MSRYGRRANLAGRLAGAKDEAAAARRAARGSMVPESARIDYQALSEIDAFLEGLGVWKSSKFQIVKMHGEKSLDVLKADPWEVARHVKGLGFLMADKIAERAGVDMKSPTRIRAGIMHVVREACWQGGAHAAPPEGGDRGG